MRLIVDTQILLRLLTRSPRLPSEAATLVENGAHQVFYSVVSIWEIAIKAGLGRPDFAIRPEQVVQETERAGLVELAVRSSAAIRVAALPRHHRDPFNRLLVAQAIDEGASLITADRALSAYGPSVLYLRGHLN